MLNLYKENFGMKADEFPGARDADRNTMAIPLHNKMVPDDFNYIIKHLKKL
jgi:dTDP-4-amino-4,6-dideoxygalactose transaminase